MTRRFTPSQAVSDIRRQIDHPIVDSDGHLFESVPAVREILGEVASPAIADRFMAFLPKAFSSGSVMTPVPPPFCGGPSSTLDRLTVVLPRLMYERLDEFGIDFALLYMGFGLPVTMAAEEDLRRAGARALNTYYAEAYGPYRDRLEPVAVIPTHTPEEALDELEYAVTKLGLKAISMSGVVPRKTRRDGSEVQWLDTLAHDSLYDYDPFWRRCAELRVVPTFHGLGYGWGSRVSSTNYVYNHLGSFGAAQEAICRSLVMAGVPERYPALRFGFLEGGVSWAIQLFGDLLGHYEKRNKDAILNTHPSRLDTKEAGELFSEFAEGRTAKHRQAFDRETLNASNILVDGAALDDFAESGISSPDDIVKVFSKQFFFGCEADDPTNAMAFRPDMIPEGAQIRTMFASDIGHWDVPDMRDVLPEAWELVEHGMIDKSQFRDFACGNVMRMLTAANPAFFDGTVVEKTAQGYAAEGK